MILKILIFFLPFQLFFGSDLLNQLTESNQNIISFPLDVTSGEKCREVFEKIKNRFENIDICFLSTGTWDPKREKDIDIDQMKIVMEVNFFGNVFLMKKVLPKLRESKGQVLVISSIAGKFGFFLRSSYSASKHALHGYYESLALEEEENGIAITIACPGKINTPISTNALDWKGEKHGEMDHNQEKGMPVKECVAQLLRAVSNRKREVLIGNKEIKAVTLKRFFPKLFWKIIRKQSPT